MFYESFFNLTAMEVPATLFREFYSKTETEISACPRFEIYSRRRSENYFLYSATLIISA